MKIPRVKTITEYTRFEGGLDLASSGLAVPPGFLLAGMNYEPDVEVGYSRLDGYEIYSGQLSPSDSTYFYCTYTSGHYYQDESDAYYQDESDAYYGESVDVAVGNTVTGETSAATGIVVTLETGIFTITKVTGTFVAGEFFSIGGVIAGTLTSILEAGEPTALGHATALAAAADIYRADISAPTGSGTLRGLGILNGVLYCFRDNAGGTAGLIYKATTSGWSNISLYHELSFDTGVGEISDGAAITQLISGAAATVKRTVHESGTWAGSNAAGRLILSGITGTFDNTHDIQVGGVTKATSTGTADQITISPGGTYEIVQSNFTGLSSTIRLYGCDGVNRGFEFDGAIYVPIDTGMSADTPERVAVHKKQLFFTFEGSSQNSGIGTPYVWTVVTGAAEIGMGEDIVGIKVQQGDVLAIFTRNATSQLQGANVADFVLFSISPETGAIARTIQNIGTTYCLDDRGIINTKRSEIYGNFEQGTVSSRIQSLINDMREVVVASAIYKSRNQYRLYGSDGTGICMGVKDISIKGTAKRTKGYSFTQFEYPVNVACAISGENANGKDVIYFGASNGKVYQADKGTSFDGEEIEAFLKLPFNNSKSPSALKSYRKCMIELTAIGYSSIRFQPDFSYGDPDIPAHSSKTFETQGAGGYWDMDNWDSFYYDSPTVANPSFSINGTGTNLGLVVYSKSAIDQGHKIDGAIVHYTPRRLVR